MIAVGTLGGTASVALAINNLGQVTGRANDPIDDLHAFYWDRTARMNDLNSQISSGSGWELQAAASISDAGEIAGYGLYKLEQLACVLSPLGGRSLTKDDLSKATGAIELIRQ